MEQKSSKTICHAHYMGEHANFLIRLFVFIWKAAVVRWKKGEPIAMPAGARISMFTFFPRLLRRSSQHLSRNNFAAFTENRKTCKNSISAWCSLYVCLLRRRRQALLLHHEQKRKIREFTLLQRRMLQVSF